MTGMSQISSLSALSGHCPHPDGGDDVAGSHDLGLAAAPGVHTEPEQEQVQVLETREVLTTVNMQ